MSWLDNWFKKNNAAEVVTSNSVFNPSITQRELINIFKSNKNFDVNFNRSQSSFHKEREVFLFGIFGTNRTGKSALARKIAIDWKMSNPNGIIMAHNHQKRFNGICDFEINPNNKNWEKDILKLRNALLILDDYRIIYPNRIHTKEFAELMYQRAQYNIDIIYICHNPSLILNILTYFTTHYFLFYTQSKQGQFESKIPNFDLCYGASVYINKYVRKHGRGEYPDFPYIMIDNEKGEIFGFNMTKPL